MIYVWLSSRRRQKSHSFTKPLIDLLARISKRSKDKHLKPACHTQMPNTSEGPPTKQAESTACEPPKERAKCEHGGSAVSARSVEEVASVSTGGNAIRARSVEAGR